jgi:fatty-acyl-CoA synthase
VLDREGAISVVHDAEFERLLAPAAGGRLMVTTEQLGDLVITSPLAAPPKTEHAPRMVVLTSGTTGAPRGAARSSASIDDVVSFLSRIPLRSGETTVIASPVFHAWGLAHLSLAMLLGSTVVLQRRFEPAKVLQAIEDHEASCLVVVPVMLSMLLDAGPESYDLSPLRVVASSGSALPGELASKTLEALGPVLYNLYGSTEAAYAAIATPADLAEDPRTAGKPPYGVTLRLVDSEGVEVPPGTPGRIFVGSPMSFEGYTDGSDKDRIDGLVATGDLGVLDAAGRLTVLGRDDDMVVIGGENVYPGQVEDAILSHPRVSECAVTAADDPAFGTKLVAHVVGEVDADELKALVREQVARFAVPREFRFVSALPRNATGKVLKRELA